MGKVIRPEELKRELDSLRASRKRIVFTNGCFDIIHAGHVRYLREARKLGDLLVVGLNSDASVRRLKPGRPIIGEQERAEVLSSLEMVDYVSLFEEDTPYRLIGFLRPDVLVKGGDWKREDIVGSDLVPETLSLPYVSGISTTEILKRLQNAGQNKDS